MLCDYSDYFVGCGERCQCCCAFVAVGSAKTFAVVLFVVHHDALVCGDVFGAGVLVAYICMKLVCHKESFQWLRHVVVMTTTTNKPTGKLP